MKIFLYFEIMLMSLDQLPPLSESKLLYYSDPNSWNKYMFTPENYLVATFSNRVALESAGMPDAKDAIEFVLRENLNSSFWAVAYNDLHRLLWNWYSVKILTDNDNCLVIHLYSPSDLHYFSEVWA